MSGHQADFMEELFRPRPDDERLDRLILFLEERKCWITAKQLKQIFRFDDRTCRALAEASRGQIISGQKGYKSTYHATPEECRRATNWLRSQAKKMDLRAGDISRFWHSASRLQRNCNSQATA